MLEFIFTQQLHFNPLQEHVSVEATKVRILLHSKSNKYIKKIMWMSIIITIKPVFENVIENTRITVVVSRTDIICQWQDNGSTNFISFVIWI